MSTDAFFREPLDPDKWSEVLDARAFKPLCAQPCENCRFSEDCLYLNVFTPTHVLKNKQQKLPVIIYIDGGYFRVGGGGSIHYDARFTTSGWSLIFVETKINDFFMKIST